MTENTGRFFEYSHSIHEFFMCLAEHPSVGEHYEFINARFSGLMNTRLPRNTENGRIKRSESRRVITEAELTLPAAGSPRAAEICRQSKCSE